MSVGDTVPVVALGQFINSGGIQDLSVRDETDSVLASATAIIPQYSDKYISYTATKAGKHIIRVASTGWSGWQMTYRLFVLVIPPA